MEMQLRGQMQDFTKTLFPLIVGLLFLPGFSSPDTISEPVAGAVGERLDEYLTRVEPFGFSGAVLVAKDSEVLLNRGYGIADRSRGVPNTADTVYSTGSITKQFTSAGIMKLEMQGRLNTFDPIAGYLPGVPSDKADITIHQLLTHTAGVTVSSGPDYERIGRGEAVSTILDAPLRFAPGEKFEYTNSGYTLLAAIIEKVSRQPYEHFLRENLFEPAGMEFTGYRLPRWQDRTVAHWYVGEVDNGTPLARPYPYWNLLGNGGILSTTEDMFRWHQALLDETVLSSEAKEKLFTPELRYYAYGWDVRETEHGTLIEHNGGSMLGNSAEMLRYVDAGVVVVLFCNQSYGRRPACELIKDKVVSLAFDGEVTVPAAVDPTRPAETDLPWSEFELPSGGRLTASAESGFVTLAARGQDAVNALLSPDPDETLTYDQLNRRSVAIFEAAARGDYSELESALAVSSPFGQPLEPRSDRLYRVRRAIDMVLRQADEYGGGLQTTEAVGTVPSFLLKGGAVTTVELRSGKGDSVFFRIAWFDKEVIDLGPVPSGHAFEVRVLPVGRGEFVGYDIGTASGVRFEFLPAEVGSVAALRLDTDAGQLMATGVPGQRVPCTSPDQGPIQTMEANR